MKYLIELVADAKGLEPGVDALEQIGQIDKANSAQFKKTNEDIKKYSSSLDGVSKAMKETSKAATGAFGGAAIKDATKAATSFRTQMRQSREEVTKLFVEGKATTAEIYKMAKGGGALKDAMMDAQQAISILASDTFKFDAALQGVQLGAAGFQAIQAGAALFGKESEDLQKTLVLLNATMAGTQAIQQIVNLTQKQSALSLGLNIAAQKTYTLVVGESVGITKAFRITLASLTGAIAIFAIYEIVKAFQNYNKELRENNKALQDAKKAGSEFYASETTQLNTLLDIAKNKNLSDKTRNEALKQINTLYPEYLKNLSLDNIGTKEQNDLVKKQTELITKLAILKGSTKVIEDLGKKLADLKSAVGDETIINRLTTAFSNGLSGIFMSADEATKKYRQKQESESTQQIERLKKIQQQVLSEVDALGFGKQGLEALGISIGEEKKGQNYDAQLKLQQLYINDKAEMLKQEIELWRAAANELDKHSIERFNIEVNIANNEKKIALLNAKTLSEKLKAEEDFNQKVLGLRKELRVEIEKINSVGLQAEVGSEEWYKKQIAYWEELLSKLRFGSAAYITIRDEIKKLNDELDRLKNPLANLEPKPQGKTTAEEIKERVDKAKTIAQAEIEIAQQTADTIFTITNQRRNDEFNLQIQRLNEAKERELSNKELTEEQKARIESRYQRQIAEIKTRQAQAEKRAALAQAAINGALAITKIISSIPGGPLNPATIASIAIAAATTAAQIAVISAQKIPKFAKGTEFVNGAGTSTSDSIPAMLSKGERVVDAKTNALLKGIPNKMLPMLPDLLAAHNINSNGMDYDKMAKSLSKELKNNPMLSVKLDKKGFETFLVSKNTTTIVKNNRHAI